ncbi:hypothetical protein HOY82DRAFT_597231 [Tuber indicum]|nr:hypothetical protein HOY82DRAFT_597231 [Tuber indicum]
MRQERSLKWSEWMDQAVVRQVLTTDPINCGKGSTVAKWSEVSATLQKLEPQPISKSAESCRQRVKKLVEIYKSGTDEEFGEFELNMVELVTRWDQSSTDPETRRLAQLQAAQLELDGKRPEGYEVGITRSNQSIPPKKKTKNWEAKSVEKALQDFAKGVEENKEELKQLEQKVDEKHDDLMYGILSLTEEIREQSECRSHDAFLEREAWKEELAMILEALRKDNEI